MPLKFSRKWGCFRITGSPSLGGEPSNNVEMPQMLGLLVPLYIASRQYEVGHTGTLLCVPSLQIFNWFIILPKVFAP